MLITAFLFVYTSMLSIVLETGGNEVVDNLVLGVVCFLTGFGARELLYYYQNHQRRG